MSTKSISSSQTNQLPAKKVKTECSKVRFGLKILAIAVSSAATAALGFLTLASAGLGIAAVVSGYGAPAAIGLFAIAGMSAMGWALMGSCTYYALQL